MTGWGGAGPPGRGAGHEGAGVLLGVLALGGLAWWGADTGGGLAAKILLGAGAPVLAAVAWGLFAAPRARFQVPLAAVLVVKVIVFGLGGFAVVVVINTALATVDRDALKGAAAY